MSQIIPLKSQLKISSVNSTIKDYIGYMKPFIKRVNRWYQLPPFIALKTIEYSIYKWYEPNGNSWKDHKYELFYHITNHCTDRCPKCGIWKNPEKTRISINQVLKSFRHISSNLYKITITGGEPLIYKNDVLKIAKTTAELDIPLTIVTNGYLLNRNFLQDIKTLNCNVIISIDTLDEKKWKQFRGRNHYHTIMKNLEMAIDILDENLSIQTVKAYETADEIQRIQDFCSSNKIDLNFQDYQDFGGDWHSITDQGFINNNSICSAWLNVCILPNGDIVKCFDYMRIPEARIPLGNIGKEDIKSILTSKRTNEITKIMKRCDQPCKMLRCNLK